MLQSWVLALTVSFFFGYHGYKKQTLSFDGAMAAIAIGTLAFVCPHPIFPTLPITFYITGSRLTKFGAKQKKMIETTYHGRRTAIQVLCNSASGTLIALLFLIATDFEKPDWIPFLLYAYIGHYACACGDTFASELGRAFPLQPVLITTFQKVPSGTNGGITVIGTLGSILGGLVIGVVSWLCTGEKGFIVLAMVGGLMGSMFDSFLGATCQSTYYDPDQKKIFSSTSTIPSPPFVHISGRALLSNELVNFWACAITSCLVGLLGVYFFF